MKVYAERCPFCGGAIQGRTDGNGGVSVECIACLRRQPVRRVAPEDVPDDGARRPRAPSARPAAAALDADAWDAPYPCVGCGAEVRRKSRRGGKSPRCARCKADRRKERERRRSRSGQLRAEDLARLADEPGGDAQ